MALALLLFAIALKLWGFPVAVGALFGAAAAFRAGQYHRGFTHSRGIWRTHKAAIRGGHR